MAKKRIRNLEKERQWAKNYRDRNKDVIRAKKIEYNKKNPHWVWAKSSIKNHKKNGFIINITLEELINFAKKQRYCYICGKKLRWEQGSTDGKLCHSSPTLDRANNDQEINISNIQILCHRCNRMKGELSMGDFVIFCGEVYRKFNSK